VSSDENIIRAFITAMEKISHKIEYEISNLKKKIKYEDIPELKDYHMRFLNRILEPIFETNEIIKYDDIENYIEENPELDYRSITIRSYLCALNKGKKIEKISRGRYKRVI